jgi:COMPASS component SWD3
MSNLQINPPNASMPEYPKSDDAISSPQVAPESGLVLGGIAGLKQKIFSDNEQLKIAALDALLNCGDDGLECLVDFLRDPSEVVRCHAYKLLTGNPNLSVQAILESVHPQTLFQCVRSIERSDSRFCLIPASESTIQQYPQGRVASAKKFGIQVWDLNSTATIHLLKGHSHYVLDLAVTPDARQLISASKDKTIRVWNLESGELVYVLNGHSQQVNAVVVSFDGRYLFSGSRDKTIKVWDLYTGKEIKTLTGKSSAIFSLALSPDGQTIVSSTQKDTIKVWDWQAGKLLHTLRGGSSWFTEAVIHPNGELIYGYRNSNQIKVWNLAMGKLLSIIQVYPDVKPEIMRFDDGTEMSMGRLPTSVESLAVMPDGRALVIGGGDGSLKFWDLLSNVEIMRYQVPLAKHTEQIVPAQDSRAIYGICIDHSTHNPTNSFHVWQCQHQQSHDDTYLL